MRHLARTKMISSALLLAVVGCGPADQNDGGNVGGNAGKGGNGGSSSGGSGSLFGGSNGSNAGSTGSGAGSSGSLAGSTGSAGSTANPFAGATGSAGSGAGGSGGSTTPAAVAGSISDLENGKNYFMDMAAGIVGAWFSYADSSVGAMLTPAQGMPFTPTMPGHTGMYAACLKGSGFTMWGAGMGFNLNDPGDGKGGSAVKPFDATKYTGITFWAKANATVSVKAKFPLEATDPAGGKCDVKDTTGGPTGCYNHPAAEVVLGTAWEQKTIRFADLAQEPGWGLQALFSPTTLYGVRFEVGKDAGMFEICLDDVAFTK